jgi:hypothetical protein
MLLSFASSIFRPFCLLHISCVTLNDCTEELGYRVVGSLFTWAQKCDKSGKGESQGWQIANCTHKTPNLVMQERLQHNPLLVQHADRNSKKNSSIKFALMLICTSGEPGVGAERGRRRRACKRQQRRACKMHEWLSPITNFVAVNTDAAFQNVTDKLTQKYYRNKKEYQKNVMPILCTHLASL